MIYTRKACNMKYCDAKASKEASNACNFDCRDAKVRDCFAQSNMVFKTRIDTQQSMRSLIVCNNFNYNALQYAV